MTEATVTGKRLALPNDILLELVGAVTPSSQVCLALTPHRFDDLIISANGEKLLGDLRTFGGRRTYPWEGYFSEQRCEKRKLMVSLVTWVPPRYKLCLYADKFIDATQNDLLCQDCRRV